MESPENFQKYSILLFDDDLIFYNLLKIDLKDFCTIELKSHFDSVQAYNFKKYDAILVDLDIGPELKGETLISFFKEINLSIPTIVLSADENQNTKIRLLKMGIDDYLWKSMPKEEIELRIQNSILRFKNRNEKSLGNLTLTRNLDLMIDGLKLESSKIEYKCLDIILARFPDTVTHADLKTFVWNQDFLNKGTINTLVWQLNKKLSSWTYRISYSQEHGIQLQNK